MKLTALAGLVAVCSILPQGAVAQDVAALQESCNAGAAEACHELGVLFLTGEGVERDPRRAAVYQERACNEGAMRGCMELGLMHLRGEGVRRDSFRGVDLLDRACEEGELAACARLGTVYTDGRAFPQDLEIAFGYFDRACSGGNLVGCANLGLLYQTGAGVEADQARARDLFRQACRGGLSEGCSLLTDGNWRLEGYDATASEAAETTLTTRSSAGTAAMLHLSCGAAGAAGVSIDWLGRSADEGPRLRTALGSETTGADAWVFDPDRNGHRYRGDARALIATLTRLEGQILFVSADDSSTSFALSGLSEVVFTLGDACGWEDPA